MSNEHETALLDDRRFRSFRSGGAAWYRPDGVAVVAAAADLAAGLLIAGANPAAVQPILRHSGPRITTKVCGHLLPGYLRAEIDRLSFGVDPGALGSNGSHRRRSRRCSTVAPARPGSPPGSRTTGRCSAAGR